MKNITPTEYDECVALVDYLELLIRQGKVLRFTHIPNETYTKFWTVKLKNKKQGVRSGFPDYVIVTKKEILFIEMKRKKGGTVSPEQILWIDDLNMVYGNAVVCKGFDEAKKYIDSKL